MRDDGAVVGADGRLIRAATWQTVGAPGDQFVHCAIVERSPDGAARLRARESLRLGALWIDENGHHVMLANHIFAKGLGVTADGFVAPVDGSGPAGLFHWTLSDSFPKPEDYVLARSGLTLDEIYAAPWEGQRPPPNIPLALRGENAPDRTAMSRRDRRAREAMDRKAGRKPRKRRAH